MTLRDSKLTPVAFWLAFLALGFVTSFASPKQPSARDEVVAEREPGPQTGKSAQD
jgi:hypothetical protein